MGIQGLLPLLKSIMVPIHIKELEGCSVTVDTYSWLHKGALSCSRELCKGIPTSRHIEYCMHRVNLLRHYGVKPILVFDGGLLPMKSEQENKRARVRKENFARAVEHESSGNAAATYACYQKAVDISPLIARDLIQVLKQEKVSYIVAPYEADAQMTFLAVSRHVEAVITEDSDLIPFGCPRIIFKMDKFGQGVEFQNSMLHKNRELTFEGFSSQMLLEMCILSGCDYLQSLPGMGLRKAHALIKKFKSYDKVIKHLMYSSVSIPPSYEESFKKAILTFQHQRVYDPVSEDVVHLTDMVDGDSVGDNSDFLGPSIPKDIAQGIAKGDLDPFTKMPFQGEDLGARWSEVIRTSQPRTFCLENTKKRIDLPVQKNLLTNYFCFASLEAKRKFRAPRMSHNCHNPLYDSSVSLEKNVSLEAPACEANSFGAYQINSRSPQNSILADNIEEGLEAKVPELVGPPCHGMLGKERISAEQTSLQPSRLSIHKPGLELQKELECKDVQGTVEAKTITETRKVIVRSKYFQHKSSPKNENILDIANGSINLKKSTMSGTASWVDYAKNKTLERKCYTEVDNPIESMEFKHLHPNPAPSENGMAGKERLSEKHTSLQQPRHSIYKPCLTLHKELECKDVQDTVEGKPVTETRKVIVGSKYFPHKSAPEELECKDVQDTVEEKQITETRKVIVRSKYFQHKSAPENEKLLDNADGSIDVNKNTKTESASCIDNAKNNVLKRKFYQKDNDQNGNMEAEHMDPKPALPENVCCAPSPEGVTEMMPEDKNFSSNISHLGHYSGIAEKSIERFVSEISKFRYSPSGARASGLRAPLKDVKNTSANRPMPMDLNQFTFVPTNKQKTFLTSGRR